jgi:hypothetical protein
LSLDQRHGNRRYPPNNSGVRRIAHVLSAPLGLLTSNTAAGAMVVTYTGLLREGRIETLWYVAADASLSASAEGVSAKINKLNWWRAITTNADTFERVS